MLPHQVEDTVKRPHGDDASKTYQTATFSQRAEINGDLDPIPGRGRPGLHDDDLPPNIDVLLYKGDTTTEGVRQQNRGAMWKRTVLRSAAGNSVGLEGYAIRYVSRNSKTRTVSKNRAQQMVATASLDVRPGFAVLRPAT
ncbi:hypothetical protein AAL_00082 [Moelleriella libera RCEF 2490]|uniref:Uncharacterized protein n=1 Tax=Moelleriella libera RCEF 2490 TaxID=1081109 RepID=A0A166UJL9_9HYPO|nr:hypothetical protein AAL_00082 [Moelleriella libera RCEF 2490]